MWADGDPPDGWELFKESVEAEFGLSEPEKLETFYNTQPRPDETTPDFVLRLEKQRRLLGVKTDRLISSFKAHFHPQFARECETARIQAKLTARPGESNVL